MKRKITYLLIVVLITTCVMSKNTFASSKMEGNILTRDEQSGSFTEARDNYEYIDKKVKDEVRNNTEVISVKVEKFLNKNGIFDEEICNYSDEEIDKIEDASLDEITISSAYYAVNDTEELEEEKIEENEMIKLTDEETDDYIAQKYYNVDMNLSEKIYNKFNKSNNNEKSIIQRIGIIIGLIPVTVRAETQSKGGKSDSKNPTMLKKTIIVIDKSNRNINVIARYVWTEMPKYRELDSVSLYWDNARYQIEDAKVYHLWDYEHYTIKSRKTINYKYEEHLGDEAVEKANPNILKNNQFFACNSYICAAVKLHRDKTQTINTYWHNYNKYYLETVTFNLTLKRIKGTSFVKFYPYYDHTKTTYDLVSVALDILDGGKISAAYSLTSGAVVKVNHEYSGVNEAFKFDF